MKNKIVIEISGGMLTQVWAQDKNIEVVLIDHDNPSVNEESVLPLCEFPVQDYLDYDGGYPDTWGNSRAALLATVQTPLPALNHRTVRDIEGDDEHGG